MLNELQGFHIEPTNICTLKCPRCARTDFINKFPTKWKNKQLNLESFKKFIDIDITNRLFHLCGNYGDPIYYNHLFEMVKWIKKSGGRIKITTNGSYKTAEWWTELGTILDQKDVIVFSIDGIPENFTKYRINADWESIKLGIQTIAKYVEVNWKYIPFKFNEDNIEKAKTISLQLGVHSFVVEPSSRWNSPDDPLKPNWSADLYNQKVNWIPKSNYTLDPKCKNTHSQHFISADGYYLPCCYVGDHRFYYSSEFYKNKKKYNISNSTISSVIESLADFYNNIENTKTNYCTFNCPKL